MSVTIEGTRDLWDQMREAQRSTKKVALIHAMKRKNPEFSEDIIRNMAYAIAEIAYGILKDKIENLQVHPDYNGWKKIYYEGSKAHFLSPLEFRHELEEILRGKGVSP
jgi:glucan biosynthesis protein